MTQDAAVAQTSPSHREYRPEDTLTVPACDRFLERLLIGARLVDEKDFVSAMREAADKGLSVATVLVNNHFVDQATINLARDMQRLVEKNFVDVEWCMWSLRESVKQLPRAELHLYPGMRHGLQQVADDVASRIHDFVDSLREEASGRPA